MRFKVIITPDFKKFFKRLSKKYPSLKKDLSELIKLLEENPDHGISLGHGIYKIRMAISSKGKGKSGGARVISYLINDDQEVFLVHIFEKDQMENISKEGILYMLKKAGLI